MAYKFKIVSVVLLNIMSIQTHAHAALSHNDIGGSVEAVIDGRRIAFPALKTNISADIKGDLATVTVQQTFKNPTEHPFNAQYLFPLNKDAAVYAMEMKVGDEHIKAEIKEIQQAKRTFNQAKKAGKAASLLTQHRPNMFTQNIANLVPGSPITVTLSYVQTIPKVDGDYKLIIPLIVGPRYQPVHAGKEPDNYDDGEVLSKQGIRSDTAFGQWELERLPEYPNVASLDIPDMINTERVSIAVNIDGGMPVESVISETHAITVTETQKHQRYIQLSKERVIDNKDFVLKYRLSGETTKAGLLTHQDSRGGFFSMLIEPPTDSHIQNIVPREMVFVLDTSGSMSGAPMEASKKFMRHALSGMKSQDYFRIIPFNNSATEYSSEPVRANPSNIATAINYVNGLYAHGGTEIPNAIDKAFSVPAKDETLRIVVFLSDGYIGNESEVLRSISQKIGQARIYAFGVGTSVNRYLLSEMGKQGRGFARFIDPNENANEVAIEFANKIQAPVLTDITIDWGGLTVSEVTPTIIPDLFAGDSIRIQGRYESPGNHTIRVSGKVGQNTATLPVELVLPKTKTKEGEAIALVWARTQIAEYMRALNTVAGARLGAPKTDDALKSAITQLGLTFSLSTRWTSFVAVSEKIYNRDSANTQESNIALPMVSGVSRQAYGNHNSFAGGSTPEPELLSGFLVMGFAVAVATVRRRKTGGKTAC